MKFKVGDLVQLLDENHGGIIISCIPPDLYEIRTPDGFEEKHKESSLVHAPEPSSYPYSGNIKPKEFIGRTNYKRNPISNSNVVDLHYYDSPGSSSLNNPAIKKQLDRVRQEMEKAMIKNTKEIIFIHGKGKGILRLEIRKLLKTYFPEARFMDASFKEFGMNGATKVLCY